MNERPRVVMGEFMSLLSAPRNRSWIGCVDFGTALSKVALIKRKATSRLGAGDIVPLAVGSREMMATQSPYMLPSLVYVSDGGVLFGAAAQAAALRGERSGRQAFSSPKQYLSTHDSDALEERLTSDIDPTGQYSPRALLTLFLAYLLLQAQEAAKLAKVPWPVPLRVARPAWDRARAEAGERTLKSLLLDAFAAVDQLGDKLQSPGELAHDDARTALAKIAKSGALNLDQHSDVFELESGSGKATILEATAVAAGLVRRAGRRVVVVVDIGAGTSDFGTFMTGLPGHNVVGEIPAGSQALREAGDHIDMLMTRHILDQAGIDPNDPAGRAAAARLRVRQRANKEVLFNDGEVSVELNDDVRTVKLQDFLGTRRVQEFSDRLRSKFSEALAIAVECARQYSPRRDRPVPIEIILTGGGHSLPMVTDLVANPPMPWAYTTSLRNISDLADNSDLRIVARQLAVAVGGAIEDIPQHTAPVRV